MHTNNSNEVILKETFRLLRNMNVGDVLGINIGDSHHLLKRMTQYEWEYICKCCYGKRLAIVNNKLISLQINEMEK